MFSVVILGVMQDYWLSKYLPQTNPLRGEKSLKDLRLYSI